MDKQNKHYSQLADMAKEYSQLVGIESCSIDREIEKVKQMQVQAYTLNSLLQLDLDTIKEFYEGEKEHEQYSE